MTTPHPERATPTDVSRLLGLHTEGAHLIIGLVIVSNAVFTFATANVLDHPWASYLAMLLVCAGAVLIGRPYPDPFPLRLTLIVVGIVAVSSLLVSYALPDAGSLGRATWHLGGNTWLIWFLILRRRVLLAWTAGLFMVAVTVVWSDISGRGAISGLTLAQAQIALMVVATFFGASLRRTAQRINELTERSVGASAVAASANAAQEIRLQRAAELASTAVPMLDRIATGVAFSSEERAAFARVEAHLRDGVRGRSLMVPVVVGAVGRARERGIEVTLLDDRGSELPSPEAMAEIGIRLAAALDSVHEGSVTIRLLPPGRDTAITMVTRKGEATSRLALTGEGDVAS
ncbi:hypothetical protein [Demequina sp.]|uniref:hypothetical protein n=1 Tax=Demequina sp. TaxID=2050685 RepID=UPI003D14E45A